jgi:hypothetical protein
MNPVAAFRRLARDPELYVPVAYWCAAALAIIGAAAASFVWVP